VNNEIKKSKTLLPKAMTVLASKRTTSISRERDGKADTTIRAINYFSTDYLG